MSKKYFLSTFSVYNNSQNMHIFAFCETHQKNAKKLVLTSDESRFKSLI